MQYKRYAACDVKKWHEKSVYMNAMDIAKMTLD